MPRLILSNAYTVLLHCIVALTALLGAALTHAAPHHASTEQVAVRLIPERTRIAPGSEVMIGLEQKILPGWHTYWQNPGDSGLPTQIEWHLPPGSSASPLLWPVPTRHKQGELTNFGYSGRVLLLSALKVPADAQPGSIFPIHAKVSWLVCDEVCIPQQAELGLELAVAATAGPASNDILAARAALPQPSPWPAGVNSDGSQVHLRIHSPELAAARSAELWFYPLQWGKIEHGAPQAVRRDGDSVILDMRAGETPGKAGEALEGLLTIAERTGDGMITRGFNLRAEFDATVPAAGDTAASSDDGIGILTALLLAFAGGLVLNLMPCVFPVLSLKALALVRHGAHADRSTRLHGLAYTAGIVMSFLVLAGALLALRAGGAEIGWGFQFQSPGFVLALAWLMFAIGLSLSGVFTLGNSVVGLGDNLAAQPGYRGSFFTGVLATVVATPCTAPFMGVAIGYALSQSALEVILIFSGLGLGLALPYLLLSNWPLLQRCLPKPGPWMERLKQVLAFPMYATALWLAWVLVQQTGTDTLLLAFGGMLVIALAAWIFGSTRSAASGKRRVATLVSLVLLIGTGTLGYLGLQSSAISAPAQHATAGENWEPYSEARLQALRSEDKPVFLNFTAAWCITCLANERVALSKENVMVAFREQGITYLKGDWTNQDAAITRKLAEFGRNGVPLYVYYPAGKDSKPVVLPQLLTPEIVLEHIRSTH